MVYYKRQNLRWPAALLCLHTVTMAKSQVHCTTTCHDNVQSSISSL